MIDTTQTNLVNTIFLFDTSFEHGNMKGTSNKEIHDLSNKETFNSNY